MNTEDYMKEHADRQQAAQILLRLKNIESCSGIDCHVENSWGVRIEIPSPSSSKIDSLTARVEKLEAKLAPAEDKVRHVKVSVTDTDKFVETVRNLKVVIEYKNNIIAKRDSEIAYLRAHIDQLIDENVGHEKGGAE